MPAPEAAAAERPDHRVICGLVEPGARVLDLGCGRGDLLALLVREKKVLAQGIELREEAIYDCVEKGLSVLHGDIESGLGEYPDKSFDYVVLNQSMQETRNVDFVLREALRVGKRAVVGFPNLAHVKSRFDVFFLGRSPISRALPYRWHDTPNVHFLSVTDFRRYCAEGNFRIVAERFLSGRRTVSFWPNLLAENAVFVIES